MAVKIRKKTSEKKVVRFRRKGRIRSRVVGSAERPRLVVFRSNENISAQIIDDAKGHTLVAASSLEKELGGKVRGNVAGAKVVGALVAKRALEKSISAVVFDRAGYVYHGKVKAFADAAREAGLKF